MKKAIVKNLTKGTKTACYFSGDTRCDVVFTPGYNSIDEEVWEKIAATQFMKNKLKFDEMTVSFHEEEVAVDGPEIDMAVAEGFIGSPDSKDLLWSYAKKFGYELSKRKNTDNMLTDLKAAVEGK